MGKTIPKCKDLLYSEVLENLLRDPTKRIHEIAEEMGSYRQKVWREKKRLEEEKVIWGYTAVVDESKLDHVTYIVLFKTRPLSRGGTDLILKRIMKEEAKRELVRILGLCYTNGDYDFTLRFAAQNHTCAKKYYDHLRLLYDDFLIEKPTLLFQNMCLISEGKMNPMVSGLYDFIPD